MAEQGADGCHNRSAYEGSGLYHKDATDHNERNLTRYKVERELTWKVLENERASAVRHLKAQAPPVRGQAVQWFRRKHPKETNAVRSSEGLRRYLTHCPKLEDLVALHVGNGERGGVLDFEEDQVKQ